MSAPRFVPGVRLEGDPPGDAWAFAFRERKLLLHRGPEGLSVPRLGEIDGWVGGEPLYLGALDGDAVVTLELTDAAKPPASMAIMGLRGALMGLDADFMPLAGRAIQILDWDRDHRFCGRCGHATEPHPEERSKKCPECGLVSYPRLSPAVIVLVERGDEVLLARSPHFPPGMYSTLAGFVEPGETLEETVVREIEEEVGVLVGDIRYFGSQPWPFPNSLMIGFLARYESGEVRPNESEIENAGWYTADAMPQIPPRISIARRLIDSFLERPQDGAGPV